MGALALVIFLPIILSIPGWMYFKRKYRLYWWDYGLNIYAISLWFCLPIGSSASLSNMVVEIFIISGFSLLLYYVRMGLGLLFKSNSKLISVVCVLLVLCFVVLLRMLMPTLSE
jgi:hypothetical protein